MLTHHDIYELYRTYSAPVSGCILYGLVDHAGMSGLVKKLNQEKTEWISLFDGSKEEGALTVAPILFQIEADQSGMRHYRLLNWVCERGAYTSSILLLASPLAMPELARRLALRLEAVLPEEIEIMLRFFDPRIFEQLMVVLSEEQKQAFLSVAYCWWFVDRRGQLQDVSAVFAESDSFEVPLILTVKQEGFLLDASEPDQVAELLQSGVPDEYQSLPLSERYDFIVRHMAAARLVGIESTHELSLYCALALLHGEHFATQKNWEAALQDVQAGNLSLEQAAEQIEMNESKTGQA
jgi:hypothetical protein